VLSEAGSVAEPSDCASEPYNKWSDASVTALTAGSMGVSTGVGPAARVGSATAAGTVEVDGPSVASIEAAAGGSSEPELT